MHKVFEGKKPGDILFDPPHYSGEEGFDLQIKSIGHKYMKLHRPGRFASEVLYDLETARRKDGYHGRLYPSRHEYEKTQAENKYRLKVLGELSSNKVTWALSMDQIRAIGQIIGVTEQDGEQSVADLIGQHIEEILQG